MGRAARNVDGEVVLYADEVTDSMQDAIDETSRRRQIQRQFNDEHDFEPKSIEKAVSEASLPGSDSTESTYSNESPTDKESARAQIESLETRMEEAASNLEFELAADIRDRIRELRREFGLDDDDAAIEPEQESGDEGIPVDEQSFLDD